MSERIADFPARLALAVAALNLSRGRLAVEVQVDKSVVGRWLRGAVYPSDHNLSALTAVVARHRPGFNRLAWSAPMAAFQAALLDGRVEAAPQADGWLAASAAQSARETALWGGVYPGVYIQIRQRMLGNGELVAELMPVWRHGDELHFRHIGASFTHHGRALILRHQLYLISEDPVGTDALLFFILNGVTAGRALALDGIACSIQGDRQRAPAAMLAVLLRIGDLAAPDHEPDADWLAGLAAVVATINDDGRIAALTGPEVIAHVGHSAVSADSILRAPGDRGMTATDADASSALRAAVARWRQAVLGDAAVATVAAPRRLRA